MPRTSLSTNEGINFRKERKRLLTHKKMMKMNLSNSGDQQTNKILTQGRPFNSVNNLHNVEHIVLNGSGN